MTALIFQENVSEQTSVSWHCLSTKWDPSTWNIRQFCVKQSRQMVKSDLSAHLEFQRAPKKLSLCHIQFSYTGYFSFCLLAVFLQLAFVSLLISFLSASFWVPSWLQCKCLVAVVLGVHLLLKTSSYQNSDLSKYFFKPIQSKATCGHCKKFHFRKKGSLYFPYLCQLTWIHREKVSYFWVLTCVVGTKDIPGQKRLWLQFSVCMGYFNNFYYRFWQN